jgi:hypothetical protein
MDQMEHLPGRGEAAPVITHRIALGAPGSPDQFTDVRVMLLQLRSIVLHEIATGRAHGGPGVMAQS